MLGINQVNHWSKVVSRGDSVMLTCNTSVTNASQINWTKGRFRFAYSAVQNKTSSNFSSHKVRIDFGLSSELNIFNVQNDDAGLYKCDVIDRKGTKCTEWNLTVAEKPEGR